MNNLLRVARAYRCSAASAKPFEQKPTTFEDLPGVADILTSDWSSGNGSPSMDGDYADAESQKSQTSFSSDPSELSLKVEIMESVISNMFKTVSSLKNAYVQLQSANQPDKRQIADGAVVAELRKLSELKKSYRKKLANMSASQVQDDSAAQPEAENVMNSNGGTGVLNSNGGTVNDFHLEVQKKNVEVENLKDMLAQTTLRKEKLERRVQRLTRDASLNCTVDVSPTQRLLESTVLGASEAARSFTKLLMSLMKTAQWDLDAAANSIEPDINYVRRTHKKFAFESYVCNRMLSGFDNNDFSVDVSHASSSEPERNKQQCFSEFQDLRTADPVKVVSSKPHGLFGKYCLSKFTELIHPKMEESFFGNLERRKLVLEGNHPRSQFYQSYLKLAKAMWLLQRLAFSFERKAHIFQVKRNTDFSPLYMESIAQTLELAAGILPIVGFTVMPGFQVGKTIIKCQVYIPAVMPLEPKQV